MMVSVQRSKVSTVLDDHLAVLAAQALGRKLYGRQGVLDLVGDAAGDVGPGRGALRGDQLGDVVEGQHRAVVLLALLLARHAHREVALLAADDERDLVLRAALVLVGAAEHGRELGHRLGERAADRARRRRGPAASPPKRLASVMRPWRSRPMTPADTPDSTASMKRRRSVSWVLAVTRSVRWRSSSLVMALKFIDRRRRSPSPRRIGSSTLRLPRATCWAALIRRRIGATNGRRTRCRPRSRPAAR